MSAAGAGVLATLTGLALAGLASLSGRVPGIRSLAAAGRYLWTSRWVQPMCIISFVTLSNLSPQCGHFLLSRWAPNSLQK